MERTRLCNVKGQGSSLHGIDCLKFRGRGTQKILCLVFDDQRGLVNGHFFGRFLLQKLLSPGGELFWP